MSGFSFQTSTVFSLGAALGTGFLSLYIYPKTAAFSRWDRRCSVQSPSVARALLAASQYGGPDGLPPVTLTSSGQGYPTQVEEALADMWRRNLGVEVEIRQLEPDRYPYLVDEEKDQLFTLGWGADYPDPQNFLDVLFHTGTKENIGEYSNEQVDRLLEEARVEQNESTRLHLYQDAEQVIVDDAACLPVYFEVSYTLVKPYVEGYPLTAMWIPRLKYVSINADA